MNNVAVYELMCMRAYACACPGYTLREGGALGLFINSTRMDMTHAQTHTCARESRRHNTHTQRTYSVHVRARRCLANMRPSLDELMAEARARLRSPMHPTLQHLDRQWQHFQSALAVARGHAEPPDPTLPPPTAPAVASTPSVSAGGSAAPSHPALATPAGGGRTAAPAPGYPPANAAHAWLCFQLLCEGLAALCGSRWVGRGREGHG